MDKELDDILYEFAETWFDAVRDKDAKTGIKAVKQARKELQALITKEKNKARIEELEKVPTYDLGTTGYVSTRIYKLKELKGEHDPHPKMWEEK